MWVLKRTRVLLSIQNIHIMTEKLLTVTQSMNTKNQKKLGGRHRSQIKIIPTFRKRLIMITSLFYDFLTQPLKGYNVALHTVKTQMKCHIM